MPQYATYNIERIKTIDDLLYRFEHNRRIHTPKNDVVERQHLNIHHNVNAHDVIKNRLNEINDIRSKAGARRLKKNTTPAIELVLGASIEFFEGKNEDEIKEWAQVQINWAKEHFKDKGKLITYDLHRSERTPHLHLVFIPEVEKMDKRTGRLLPTMDADSFMGKRKNFYHARDTHSEVNKQFGLQRGINYQDEGKEPAKNKTVQQLRAETDRATKDKARLDIALLEKAKDFKAISSLVGSIDKSLLLALAKKTKTNNSEGLEGMDLVQKIFEQPSLDHNLEDEKK